MTQRQTGRDDAMSGISNSLTGSASNCKEIRLAGKKKKKENTFWNLAWGWRLSAAWSDVNQGDPGLRRAQEACNE